MRELGLVSEPAPDVARDHEDVDGDDERVEWRGSLRSGSQGWTGDTGRIVVGQASPLLDLVSVEMGGWGSVNMEAPSLN